MKNRWLWFSVCVILALLALAGGLMIPVYLRAVDAKVIARAGHNHRTLVEEGLTLVAANKLGAAQLLARAAASEKVSDHQQLTEAVARLAKRHPAWRTWGAGDTRMEDFFEPPAGATNSAPVPFTDFMVARERRRQVLTEWLGASQRPLVQELLRFRMVTNTVVFSPSDSASGQALDTAICVAGLLIERGHLTTGLNNKILAVATTANSGTSSEPLEQALLDLMSLGQRFNWGQLIVFISKIDTVEELRTAASTVRNAEAQLPVVFSAVHLSGDAAAVGKYLLNHSQTGLKDLAWSLHHGAGGVNELLKQDRQVQRSTWRDRVAQRIPLDWLLYLTLRAPWAGLALKWLLYLSSGFLLALALHYARPTVKAWERPLQVRGFHLARELIFALGFLVVILLASEPFIAHDSQSQKPEMPFRIKLPMAGSATAMAANGGNTKFMTTLSLLTLVLFFVLQALLYAASLLKLAEIRRQRVPSRVKLRLLDNEDHLFDAGLYLGFVGTIISLILVSLGVIKPSLMAAYSSTSFGVLFVSLFKIVNLRPLRRKLVMDSENMSPETAAPAATPSLAAPL